VSKKIGWRAAVVGILILISLSLLMPSLTKELPPWWSSVLPQEKINLGLDLQGGMHLVLEVDVDKAVETDLDRDMDDLKYDLRKGKIRYLELQRHGNSGIDLTLMREEDKEKLDEMITSNFSGYEIFDGPEKEKGFAFRLKMKKEAMDRSKKLATDQAIETIRNRIDQSGVLEPDIRAQPDHRILIQLPGVIKMMKNVAHLEFKLVDDEHSLEEALKGSMPPGRQILYKSDDDPRTGERRQTPFLLKKRAPLTGKYISDARVSIDPESGKPGVSLTFNGKGAKLFERLTGDNIGKRLAIVLDNNVYSAPSIQNRIPGGRAQITGDFTSEEARDLSIVLRAGSLPAPVRILEKRLVGPSLGQDSIDKGRMSMMIGGIIVILFMVLYYGFSGIVADLALALNVLFIMAGLAFFGATLTLPGIAGMILTIGMSVDANVLIFERIREEIRLGKTSRTAIEGGYSKAMVTILDANVTTFIVALVLFQFGTGPIRGFAVTLSIGIVASFITAVFVTRIVFDFLYVQKNWKRLSI